MPPNSLLSLLLKSVAFLTASVGMLGSSLAHQATEPGKQAQSSPTPQGKPKETAETWLPSDPAHWLNSPPITGETIRGKAALLFFFEETSPQIKKRWPNLTNLAQQHFGDPILFIAVNSGASYQTVARYAVANKVTWPILVDSDRSLERRLGIRPVNMEGATQVRLIRNDGSIVNGAPNNLTWSVSQVLPSAHWEIDANEIVDQHKLAWRLVEFKNFAPAAEIIRNDLNSHRDDVKASAQRLHAFVQQHLEQDANGAKALFDQHKLLESFFAYRMLQQEFAGYEIPDAHQQVMQQLDGDPELKTEIKAQEMLAETRALIASGDPRSLRQAKTRLNNIVRRYPQTTAAAEAKKLLEGN